MQANERQVGDMLLCEFHGCTYPPNYTCPACQRTDGGLLWVMRKLLELEKRIIAIEQAAPKS